MVKEYTVIRHLARSFLYCICISLFLSTAQANDVGVLPGKSSVTESGMATYRIPIQLPPSLSGLSPNLALNYSSGISKKRFNTRLIDSHPGSGAMGIGWKIAGLSSIQRCNKDLTRDGIRETINYDSNDQYCLDGQRLVLMAAGYYVTQANGFDKIVVKTDGNGPYQFTAYKKNGRIVTYGLSVDSRQYAEGRSEIHRWNISSINDNSGNSIQFNYEKDVENSVNRISKISYEDKSVDFIYDSVEINQLNSIKTSI
jgi:hypothetical protein